MRENFSWHNRIQFMNDNESTMKKNFQTIKKNYFLFILLILSAGRKLSASSTTFILEIIGVYTRNRIVDKFKLTIFPS